MELRAPTLAEIRAAQERLRGSVTRTPLVPYRGPSLPGAPREIHLALENLQPIGSFKLRGAGNAMLAADPAALAGGVVTASAGNMAQGVAWHARRLGIPCRVVVPDRAPRAKLDAIRALGAEPIAVPFERWWRTLEERRFEGLSGLFVHPVSDPDVIAGNATIGLEILEELEQVDAILVPFGGGGLSCGIAAAARALSPSTRVYACEVESAAPLRASLAAGRPVRVEHRPSFVDGIGSPGLLPDMWPLASTLLAGSLVVELAHVADAILRLARDAKVVAEGAGAASLAAALRELPGQGRVVCVVSGGNLDATTLARALRGEIP